MNASLSLKVYSFLIHSGDLRLLVQEGHFQDKQSHTCMSGSFPNEVTKKQGFGGKNMYIF